MNIIEEISPIGYFSLLTKPCCVYAGNTLYKNINGEIIGKPAMSCIRKDKTTYIAWREDITIDDLNLRYMNKDFTRK